LAATDDTARRPRTGAGRPDIRRRVRRQCGGRRRRRGSLIPHARPIRALVIAVIEAPLGTAPMARPGRPDRRLARGLPTRRRAEGVPPVTGRADRKGAVTPAAGLQAQGGVHHVGARGSDWTTTRKRGTTGVTGSDVGARVGHGGPVVKTGSPPSPVASAYFITHTPSRPWTLPDPWTRGRAHRSLEHRSAASHSAHRPSRPVLDQVAQTRPSDRDVSRTTHFHALAHTGLRPNDL
jgi:hypothetical protein